MPAKNDDNTQFASVSDANGNNAVVVLAQGDGTAPLCDRQGRLIVNPLVNGQYYGDSSNQLQKETNTGIAILITNSPAILFKAWGSYSGGAAVWAQIFNTAATPPAVAPFFATQYVQAANGMWVLDLPNEGVLFNTGIVIAHSTTHTTYTAAAAGGMVTALYRDV